MHQLIRVCIVGLAVMAAGACGLAGKGKNSDDDSSSPDTGVDASTSSSQDAAQNTIVGPGGACSCDADCAADAGHAGVCIYGECMTRASAPCATGGSQAECPTGSRCWNLTGWDGGSLCWPDCSAHGCTGACDADGSCVPGQGSNCNATCGAACSCTDTSCGDGAHCVQGECVPNMAGPGPGPGMSCPNLPQRDCTTTDCGVLTTFSPRTTAAWDDYPINGETATNQYRSYARKDLIMLVEWASSVIACKTANWTTGGNGGPVAPGDMSEANGAIPGTSIGSPGHPAGTHTDGYDMDIGYYQAGTADNRLRPVCDHMVNNVDQYHCIADPTALDVWRNALFLGSLFESARVRVIGVDGKVGPIMKSAIDTLCNSGWLSSYACSHIVLAYEVTNTGQGWFQFHHHHQHVSLKHTTFLDEGIGVGDDPVVTKAPASKSIPQLSTLHRVRAAQ